MIVIKDIEIVQTTNSFINLIHKCEENPSVMGMMNNEERKFTTEIIYGKQFVNPQTGKKIYLGLSKKAEEILDIPMKAFNVMYKQIADLKNDYRIINRLLINEQLKTENLEKELTYYNNCGFWKRLWFALTMKDFK